MQLDPLVTGFLRLRERDKLASVRAGTHTLTAVFGKLKYG